MLKKILPLILFILFTSIGFSQINRIIINGKVVDSISTVRNANIINLKTNQGTFTSDDGEFRIFVKEGDSLRFSSVQHNTSFIVVNKKNITDKYIAVRIKYATVVLDTFELKRNNLSGRLGIDSKQVPRNKKDSLLRKVMDFSNVDFSEKDFTIDDIEKAKPPIVNTMDGAMPMIGGATISMPFKDSERLWALRKELARKKEFPYKIMSELGEKFFFERLKIPVDNYFHFLEYCNPLGIEKMHKEGKILDLIKLFQKESKSYLEIIKKE